LKTNKNKKVERQFVVPPRAEQFALPPRADRDLLYPMREQPPSAPQQRIEEDVVPARIATKFNQPEKEKESPVEATTEKRFNPLNFGTPKVKGFDPHEDL